MNKSRKTYPYLVLIGVYLLLLRAFPVAAQCPGGPPGSISGDFDILYQGRGVSNICVGSQITVQDKKGISNAQYWFTIDPSVPNATPTTGGQNSPNFTYAKPGVYCVVQQGTLNGQKIFTVNSFRVVVPSPITLKVANCSQGVVRLTISKDANENDPNSSYGSYTVDWGDGQKQDIQKSWSGEYTLSHIYTTDTKKKIILSGHINQVNGFGCGETATTDVIPIVTELYQPQISKLTMQESGGGEMIFLQQKGGYYELTRKDPGSSTYVSTGVSGQCDNSDLKGYVMPGIDITKTTCFQVKMADQCGSQFVSQEICSIPLKVTENNGTNTLKWGQYPTFVPFKKYNLLKDGKTFYPANFDIGKLGLIGFTETTDKDYGCGSKICYQVSAEISQNVQLPLNLGGGVDGTPMLSVSNASCVQPVNIPPQPAISSIFTSVEDGKVIVIPELPNGLVQKGLNLYRKTYNESDYTLIQTTTSKTSFLDDQVNPSAGKNCYKISYIGSCDTESELSDDFCPIYLQSQGAYASWTEYVKFLLGISSYYLEKLDPTKTVISTITAGTSLGWQVDDDDNNQDVLLRVRGLSQNGLTTYSNVVSYTRPPRLYVPDVFTPNNDLVNDNLIIKGLFIKDMKMTIFDRWGSVVFVSEDIDTGWDGNVKGVPAQEGTYAYKIQITDLKGANFEREGTVLLMR